MFWAVFYIKNNKDLNESFYPRIEKYTGDIFQLHEKQEELDQSEYDYNLIKSII